MKFIHIADVHLGAEPEGLKLGSESRAKELWDGLEQVINVCEWEEIDLLLIAGDLFHRQPLHRELKELNYLFSRLSKTKVVFIVGNHDYDMIEAIKKACVFESIKFIDLIIDGDYKVCICHYPLMDWMEFNRDGLLVYGHIHNKTEKNGYAYKLMKDYYKNLKAYNAGVDVIDFEPRTLKELMKLKEVNKDEPYIN